MKTFKYFSMMLAMLVCSIGFVSCSSDDDDDPNNASIYGTWVNNDDRDDVVTTLVLNGDGTGVYSVTEDEVSITVPFEFKYKAEDNQITIIPTGSSDLAKKLKGTYEIIATQTSMSFGGVTFKRA